MGKFSRDKGNRGEYLVRDKLREAGFCVDRIPASGAAQGFKGDLRIKYDNQEILVEVKTRKKDFTKLYDLLEENGGLPSNLMGVIVTYDPVVAVTRKGTRAWLTMKGSLVSLLNRCLVYRANCDILVVKDDRRKPIYIYWEAFTEGEAGNA